MTNRHTRNSFRTLATAAGSLSIVGLVSGCSTLPFEHDAMCSEIARFANSYNDDTIHSVELITDWGAVFSEEKNEIYEKSCTRDQDEPSIRLCDYLMDHTSTEFASVNIRNALSCLGRTSQSYAGPPDSRVDYLNGEITSYHAKGVHSDVMVSVEFSTGSNEHAPSLKISAQRYTITIDHQRSQASPK